MMEHEDEAIEAESDVRIFPSPYRSLSGGYLPSHEVPADWHAHRQNNLLTGRTGF